MLRQTLFHVVFVSVCLFAANAYAQAPNPWTANLTPVVPVISGVDQAEVPSSGEGQVPFGPNATIQVKMHADGINPLNQTVRARLVVVLSQGPPPFEVHTYQTEDLIVAEYAV